MLCHYVRSATYSPFIGLSSEIHSLLRILSTYMLHFERHRGGALGLRVRLVRLSFYDDMT